LYNPKTRLRLRNPDKNFLFINGLPSHDELQIHRVLISDGTEKAGRVFAVGVYAGKPESIPADFAVIEQQLKQSAISGKARYPAPAIPFLAFQPLGNEVTSQVHLALGLPVSGPYKGLMVVRPQTVSGDDLDVCTCPCSIPKA